MTLSALPRVPLRKHRFIVQDLVDLYLEKNIEDRFVGSKLIKASRKKKGQREVRMTLYADALKVLGDKQASEIHRKDIVMMIQNIIDLGSNVQAGNVLRELTAAYEFAIGFDMFNDDFANPALLAKFSLNRTKVRLTSKRCNRTLNDAELTKLLNWLPGSAFVSEVQLHPPLQNVDLILYPAFPNQ